jgi:hypothetical protein
MAAPTTIDEAIEQAALGPASVTNADGQTVVSKDIQQLLDARNDQSAQTAAGKPQFGLRMTKLVPPGGG